MEHALPHFGSGSLGFAFGLTLLAGMATGLGSTLAFFARRSNLRLLTGALAFSAGVMLYISFAEILPKAKVSLEQNFTASAAGWLAISGFFGGIVLMAIIDALVPKTENPHELRTEADVQQLKSSRSITLAAREYSGLRRTGMFTALAIALHNFPEGMATFLAALEDPRTGVAIAAAVALHNIPEGVSVAVPIFYATGRRARAFAYSVLSGLAEPLGALVTAVALDWFLPPPITGLVFASVAGVMVYISLDELLPAAHRYGHSHEVLAGLVGGMALIAASLMVLQP